MVIKFVTAEDGTVYAVDTDVETTEVIEESGGGLSRPHRTTTSTGGGSGGKKGGEGGGGGGHGHGHRRGGSDDEPPPPKRYEVVVYSVVQTKPYPPNKTWWRFSVSRDGEPGFFNMVFPAGWPESKIRELAKYSLERYPEVFDPSVA